MRSLALALLLVITEIGIAQPQPQLIKDFNRKPADYISSGNKVLFSAAGHAFFPSKPTTIDENSKWWVTDGTPAGTHVVNPDSQGQEIPFDAWEFGGSFYYSQYGDNGSSRLMKYDPATSTVTVVKEFITGYISVFFRDHSQMLLALGLNDGTQLWTSDGTTDGTVKFTTLPDFEDVIQSSSDGTYAYFVTNPDNHLQSLYRTDGTDAGTVLLKGSAALFDNFTDLYTVGNDVYFYRTDGATHQYQFWKSDGTVAGTTMLTTISSQPQDNTINKLGSNIIFGGSGRLYITDGTVAGTQVLLSSNGANWATIFNGLYYFISASPTTSNYSLMKTDGTLAGTSTVTGAGILSLNNAAVFGDKLLVNIEVDGEGQELGIVDGAGAISLVKDINNGPSGSRPVQFTAFNNKAIFVADDGIHGSEIWVTDGTEAGTQLLREMKPGTENGYSDIFATANPNLFAVLAKDSTTVYDLWITDGTTANTKKLYTPSALMFLIGQLNGDTYFVDDGNLVKINSTGQTVVVANGTGLFSAHPWFASGGKLFFRGFTFAYGDEIWVTDGTQAGTQLFKDIAPGSAQGAWGEGIAALGKYFFLGSDGVNGIELWVTDGTDAGTHMVADLNATGNSSIYNFGLINNKVYFYRQDPTSGAQMWSTDGTEGGTHLEVDLQTGPGIAPQNFVAFGEQHLFTISRAGTSLELWKTDGTPNGTTMIMSFATPVGGIESSYISVVGDRAYFLANGDASVGRELWVTDGTQAGTKVIDVTPGPQSTFGYLTYYNNFHGLHYFTTTDGLWRSGGSLATTEKVADGIISDVTVFGDKMFLAINSEAYGIELFTMPFEKIKQTLTFETIGGKKEGDEDFMLSASATSGLPVTFSTASTSKITLTGSSVKIIKPGKVTFNATQAGTDGIASAQESQTICISPAKPTITLKQDNPLSKVLQSSAPDGNQWYLNGSAINNATGLTFEAKESGNYTVASNVDGCQGETSSPAAIAITGLEEEPNVSIFPNPAKDKLYAQWSSHSGSAVLLDTRGITRLNATFVDLAEISVSELPAGVYIIKLTAGDEQIIRKFIKE